jgi:hypothetical protein
MVQDQATHASKDDGKSGSGSPPLARIRTTWRSLIRLRSGIGPRLLASVLLFSSAITLLLTLLQLYLDYRRDVGTIENRMSAIERRYLPSLGEGLWNLSQSVSAVNPEARGEKPRTLAAVCGWLGT